MELGCSSFSWETEDGKHLLGRTCDRFGDLTGNQVVVVPRGWPFPTSVSEGNAALVEGKYCFTGLAIQGLSAPIVVDGINETGLMGALLNYPGCAVYNTQPGEGQLELHPAFFLAWLLGNCATVEEVCRRTPQVNLTDERVFGKEMAVHFILSDTTGETVILEPDKGGITIHRHTIGVMSNSPDYLWHKTNLRCYVAVNNLHKPPRTMMGEEFADFGEHVGGGFGLPGDYSSPARFVRVAFVKNYAVRGRDEVDGVGKMFHNFATVDIPEGILKAGPQEESYEQTLCTTAMCAESRTYYFATHANRRIRAIRLDPELEGKELRTIELSGPQDILYLN